MIGNTFTSGMFAETGEAAPFPHPDSCRYCRWMRDVHSFSPYVHRHLNVNQLAKYCMYSSLGQENYSDLLMLPVN